MKKQKSYTFLFFVIFVFKLNKSIGHSKHIKWRTLVAVLLLRGLLLLLVIKSLELLLLLIILIVIEPSELLLLCSEIILIIVKSTKVITWLLLSTKLTIILVILLLSKLLLLGSILMILVLLLLAIAHISHLISIPLILLKPCLEVVLSEPLSKWITLILLWCSSSKLATTAHAEHARVWYETLWLLWFYSLLLLSLRSIEVKWVAIWSLLLTSSHSEGAIVFGAVVIEEI